MTIKKVKYFLLLHLFNLGIIAQTDTIKPRIKLTSFTIGFGVLTNQVPPISQDDYKKIAPQNSFINTNLNGYTYGSAINFNGYLNLSIGFSRLNKKNNTYNLQRENRVGMRFYPEDLLPVSYSHIKQANYDTLKHGNSVLYNVRVDSTTSYNYGISSSNIMFDFGTIFQSDPKHLLVGYIGYNIGVGTTLKMTANAFRSSNVTFVNNTTYEYTSTSFNSEATSLRNSFVFNAAVVWGASLRLGKTRKFWKKTHLNLEGRFGANSQDVQNYGTFTRVMASAHFGFKFLLQ